MRGLSMGRSWRLLLILLPAGWLTGAVLARVPDAAAAVLGVPMQDEGFVVAMVLLGWLLSAGVIGLILAGIARAVGPEHVRTLLSERQAWRFGALSTAVFWVALIGLYWAAFSENHAASLFWQVVVGVAADLFGLAWLIIGVRAAAAKELLRTAATLGSGAVSSFLGGIGLGLLAYILLGGMQPGLLLFALLSLLVLLILILPPALLTAGMAALYAGLPEYMNHKHEDDTSGMPPV